MNVGAMGVPGSRTNKFRCFQKGTREIIQGLLPAANPLFQSHTKHCRSDLGAPHGCGQNQTNQQSWRRRKIGKMKAIHAGGSGFLVYLFSWSCLKALKGKQGSTDVVSAMRPWEGMALQNLSQQEGHPGARSEASSAPVDC